MFYECCHHTWGFLTDMHKRSPKVKVISRSTHEKNAKKSVLHLKLFIIVLRPMQYSTQTLYLYDI